ncbi:MAG: heavy metal-binding domain-containing protein [Streptosporangiaceae bacterium]
MTDPGDLPGAAPPPAAQARLAELRERRSWGSALQVNEFAAISRVGFQPVGQVLGAAVYNVGDTGGEECPYGLQVFRGEGTRAYSAPGPGGLRISRGPVRKPVGAAAIGSAHALVSVLYQARRAAVSRMISECAALGGHGIIGVTLTVGPFGDDDTLEFRAIGTAIRAPGVPVRSEPFASDLSGQDFTKLVAHGWIPVGLALGVAVGYRHDDWLASARWTAGNVEVEGYTYLVTQMRTDARNELELDLIRMGAEGVVVRNMETRISRRKCPVVPLGHDHVAEVTIVGTAIAQFASMAPPPIYGIRKLAGRRPVQVPEQHVSVSLEGGEAEPAESVEPPVPEADEAP